MRILNATILLAVLLTGAAAAAEGQDGKADGRTDAGASTTSMGAGGLSGTGAIRDGARTGSVESKGRNGDAKAPPAPAAGTSR
ncbi:hypothetical protein PQI07_22025 [Methylobacterium sp. 092160098-2]|uniref:hypothetical protein n=1 Tax=Methylobacterium sp. 092160098-2 TaxID=3025129 RepID=UPI002381C321|nr:hypothetical protein [Methylobacterium sp. 092160098-2]MDE4913361.1 hypothetical protein [Methylobacterium sp. 092160098-2]